MTHVKLTSGGGDLHLVVDGVDMTAMVLREGFRIVPSGDEDPTMFEVTMTLMAETLDVDVPASVLNVTRAERPDSAWRLSKTDEPDVLDNLAVQPVDVSRCDLSADCPARDHVTRCLRTFSTPVAEARDRFEECVGSSECTADVHLYACPARSGYSAEVCS